MLRTADDVRIPVEIQVEDLHTLDAGNAEINRMLCEGNFLSRNAGATHSENNSEKKTGSVFFHIELLFI
jgi:hypothetical protein